MSAEIYRCATCNSPLLADFKFCPSCGSPNAYYRPREAATATPVPLATNEPPIEQAGGSRDASAILDFAALFGYENATEAPTLQAQDAAQLSGTLPQPASDDSHQLQASSMEEIGSQIESPLDEVSAHDKTLQASGDGVQVQGPDDNAPEVLGAPEGAQVGMGMDTGPLLVTEPGSTPSGSLPEEQAAESGAFPDSGNDIAAETPVLSQSNSEESEQVYKSGASTGPLYVQDAPVVVMVPAEATGATVGDTTELDPQAEPAASVAGHDEGAEEEVEQTPSSQPAQAAQTAQTGPLSFSDLFAWTTDESRPGSYDPVISTPAQQDQDTSPAQASWQETSPPPTQLPQEKASEPAPEIVSYDSSSTHQETATQYDAPSWKPGDEDQSASQQPSWTPSPTPTTPIYQSYSPASSAAQPQTAPTSPDLPPPGQRPKPGTPEYEEMARRALETRGIQPTPPQGYQPQGSQAGQASYTQPSRQQTPTPPVAPAVPPPGQRPKPGTPEYEEMARRALEERLKQQGSSGAPAQPTPAYGYTPQSPETSYAPPPPPVAPAVPPPGQRPKPGTPEYEEMARRALEERLKQQGK